ncbi:MAG: helix-turn-helix domain-containing protein [Nanoarchaeota archaeon]|nr:helix-turn-helix domain-containing protein [Nanoarchaeota archaeon]
MTWCAKCGVSGDKENLFPAISDKGIVKVCQKCASHEGWPIIKRPADLYPKKVPVQPPISRDAPVKMGRDSKTMFDRLTRLSGVVMAEKKQENPQTVRQNQVLKEMANRNFESKIIKEKGDTSDLIDNFNWAIMRARRARHLSQQQLAEAIGESEAAIRRAEQGVLSGGGVSFVRKLENHLKIHLFRESIPNISTQELKFDNANSQTFTISDLKEIKEDEPVEVKQADLSDEEVDDILFGKR